MNKPASNICLVAISMIYICVMISSDLFVKKPVMMFFGNTTAATLIFPFWFILNDIIAEIYGYKECRKILLTGFVIQLIFNLICYAATSLPSPPEWDHQASYNFIFNDLFRIAFVTLVAFFISGYLNIRLLIKWKILMAGKYFWLRSIGSSAIGEACYSILNVWILLSGSMETSKILTVMFWSYCIKLVYTIIMAYPAVIIVWIIQQIEKIDPEAQDIFLNDINLGASERG